MYGVPYGAYHLEIPAPNSKPHHILRGQERKRKKKEEKEERKKSENNKNYE